MAEQQKALARSEAAYRQQTKILRSVLDNMGDGVLVADDSGKMVLAQSGRRANGRAGWLQKSPRRNGASGSASIAPDTTSLYPADELPLGAGHARGDCGRN